MARIAFFETEQWETPLLRKALPGHQLLFFEQPLDKRSAAKAKAADIVSVFTYSTLTADVLKQLPRLRLIATRSTGFDHIDLDACKQRGITVANVPYYGENTVAEHTFALILALSRRLLPSAESTRQGNFSPEGFTGFDLKGKTLGVIGAGHIGMHVIRIAKGFEMNVFAFDVHRNNKAAKKLGFTYASMNTLLKHSDIVTLHCPYSKQTHHLFNKDTFRRMKKGAYLINTARGGLVETDALLKALNSKHLAGAALDVLEEEWAIKEEKQLLSRHFQTNLRTVLENHLLMRRSNVIITPHNAFNSTEALHRILNTTIDNVKAYLKRKPANVVR